MKQVDMETVFLVHSGEPWQHPQPPCSRPMIQFLERNESLVTWVQPKSGNVEDQFPVIQIQGHYFTMSLRMMKAVWRSVRLRKGFVNVERALFGGLKLRIPTLLFVEKMRTQSRFNLMRMESAHQRQPMIVSSLVSTSVAFTPVSHHDHDNHDNDALPATTDTNSSNTINKPVHNASSKVTLVVRKMLLPLLDTPMHTHVVFDAESDQEELDLLEQMDRSRPDILEDPKSFVQHLQSLLGRYQTYASGYSRVSTSSVLVTPAPTLAVSAASMKERIVHTS